MNISGYIIEKYTRMPNAYTCNRLVEEAHKQSIDLKIIGVNDLSVTKDGIQHGSQLLEARDFCINRYKWGKIKDEMNLLVKRSYNDVVGFDKYINKYVQVKTLKSDAFDIPKYILGTSLHDYDVLKNYLGLPFVAKGLESSMGCEIVLIKDSNDYKRLLSEYDSTKEWLYEEFIRGSLGRDLRFYSIRGKVIACMQRKSKGDFRANVALGGSVEPYEITPEIIRIAKDIYDQTQLDFLGIDLLFGEVRPYFCEINVMPGLEGIEKASGINIAKEIIMTIKRDFIDE